MAEIRGYSPRVLIGNWKEEMAVEEETMKDFLQRKERGELASQRGRSLRENVFRKVKLSVSTDRYLRFGDAVMLVNFGNGDKDPVAVSIHVNPSKVGPDLSIQSPCEVTATRYLDPCPRNVFIITSVDNTPIGGLLTYNQDFALRTTDGFAGGLYLASDHRTFLKCAKNSRLQEVVLTDEASFLTHWQLIYLDPQDRLECEGLAVPIRSKLLMVHSRTNQCLAVLRNFPWLTVYGKEYEIAAQTFIDAHKAERDLNHWEFITGDPSNEEQNITERPNPVDKLVSTDIPKEECCCNNDEKQVELETGDLVIPGQARCCSATLQ